MSCDFELKMVVRYIDRRLLYAEANRKKMCQNKGNWIVYKMAISDFQNFWILTPKISKNKFFWKKCSKIQNFQNFQKNVLYV